MTHAFMYGTATFEGIRAYWNAGAEAALRAEGARARRAPPPVVPDPADDRRAVGRRADPADRRDRPAQRVHARTPTSARRSTSRPRRSASGSTTSRTSCTSSRCRSANYIDTERRRAGHDLVLAAERRRGAAGPRQDRRWLRQHGLPEVRSRAQRLRRGDRPDRRAATSTRRRRPTSSWSATASRSPRRSATTCSKA